MNEAASQPASEPKGFGAGLSEHPTPAAAVGEAIGQVLDAVGPSPDLALLFVTPPHAGALEDMAAAVRATLAPGTLLGCTAESVLGGAREVEQEAAVVLWAGHTGPVVPMLLEGVQTADGLAVVGWPDDADAPDASALVLLADPFSFPVEAFLGTLADGRPALPAIGGMASAARGPGGNRLVLDDRVVSSGAVGALLGPTVSVEAVVSQGCRPLGSPLVVTRAERNVVYELAGRPALERLQELATGATEEERKLLSAGLHLGRVIDEHKADFGRGDFLVRNVLGADRSNGAIAVGEECELGATVQFHVRDAASADEDLRLLLDGRSAEGALVFTCNGRGTRLFGAPDHDAEVVSEALDGAPVAGFFAAGEVGPVGGRNFLHGFTASVALLRRRRASSSPSSA